MQNSYFCKNSYLNVYELASKKSNISTQLIYGEKFRLIGIMKVFFNNSCSICRAEINLYKKEQVEGIDWVDITRNKKAEAETKKLELENADSTGRLYQIVEI